jgi:cysteine sulfinate desulfinase/cysteine desulfurase-like protein
MGMSMEKAIGSLRLTTGYTTTDDDIAEAAATIRATLARTATHA